MSYQSTTILGNIGTVQPLREVTNKSTGEIVPVLNFTVAVNSPFDQSVTWYNVSVWGKQATALAKFVATGKKQTALVVGVVTPRIYQDKDGYAAISMDMRADTFGVQIIGGVREDAETSTDAPKLKIRPDAAAALGVETQVVTPKPAGKRKTSIENAQDLIAAKQAVAAQAN